MVLTSLSSVIPLRAEINNNPDTRFREEDNEESEDVNEENCNRYDLNQRLDAIPILSSSRRSNASVMIHCIFWMTTLFDLVMTVFVIISARFLRITQLD